MKLLFIGVSAAVCCMPLGWSSSGRRCRVSHIEALDTTACTANFGEPMLYIVDGNMFCCMLLGRCG